MTENTDWLKEKAPGYRHLDDVEVNAVSDFLLLWSLFEAQLLDTEASARRICDVVKSWQDAGKLDAQYFDPELEYFRDRYCNNCAAEYHFMKLSLRNNDKKELVRAGVDGSNSDPRDRVAAILIIVYRYRNNLFHGLKWGYNLAGQLENFNTANTVLKKVLDRFGELAGR